MKFIAVFYSLFILISLSHAQILGYGEFGHKRFTCKGKIENQTTTIVGYSGGFLRDKDDKIIQPLVAKIYFLIDVRRGSKIVIVGKEDYLEDDVIYTMPFAGGDVTFSAKRGGPLKYEIDVTGKVTGKMKCENEL